MMNHSGHGQKQRSPKDPSRFFFPFLAQKISISLSRLSLSRRGARSAVSLASRARGARGRDTGREQDTGVAVLCVCLASYTTANGTPPWLYTPPCIRETVRIRHTGLCTRIPTRVAGLRYIGLRTLNPLLQLLDLAREVLHYLAQRGLQHALGVGVHAVHACRTQAATQAATGQTSGC